MNLHLICIPPNESEHVIAAFSHLEGNGHDCHFHWMHPKPELVVVFNEPETGVEADPHARGAAPSCFAARAEQSILGTLFLLALGVGYLAMTWSSKGFELDINRTILIFLLVGLALQRTPIANMLQPFWAVPVVAIAGIRIQRVMGYTAITFVVSLLIYAAALWLIP